MHTFTVAFISTLLLSPISVMSHSQNKDTDVDHLQSPRPSDSLTVGVMIKYEGEDRVRTCQVRKEDEEEEEREEKGEVEREEKGEVEREENEEEEEEEREKIKEKKKEEKKQKKKEEKKEKKKGKYLCHKVHRCKKKSKQCYGDSIKPNDGFRCDGKFIKLNKVLSRATGACDRLKSKRDRKLPALYTASDFKTAVGPYFEWPIYSKVWNLGFKQKYRLVITQKCKVVGVVIRWKDASYTQCTFGPKKGWRN